MRKKQIKTAAIFFHKGKAIMCLASQVDYDDFTIRINEPKEIIVIPMFAIKKLVIQK